VLLLQRLPDEANTFFLPEYYKHYGPASDENIQAVEQALAGR
jgi:hypothetical protein